MALVAVFARLGSHLARHVGKQGLDVAAPLNVELLVHATLSRLTQRRFGRELLAERAVDFDLVSVGGVGEIGRSASSWIFWRRVIGHLVVQLEFVTDGSAKRSADRGHRASICEQIDGREFINAVNLTLFERISLGNGGVESGDVLIGAGIGGDIRIASLFRVLLELLLSSNG